MKSYGREEGYREPSSQSQQLALLTRCGRNTRDVRSPLANPPSDGHNMGFPVRLEYQ
jgi:hypothetical protein